MANPRLFLIDTFGYLFRAFHARARTGAPPMRTSSGKPTEMVFIFNNMLKKLRTAYQPDYMAAIFESEGKTLREQEFAAYKANRTETPPELLQQIPMARQLLEAIRVPMLEFPGYEADDVIGTLSRGAVEHGVDVVIVSSDKDLLQLVNGRVSMLNPAKEDEMYTPEKVVEFMGVTPAQVADLLALKGDAVDNIPGAPGIGDKGARDLIQRFGSVEEAMARAAEVERRSYRESLQNNREQIELSKRLAVVATDVPVEWSLARLAMQPADDGALRRAYTEFEFFSQLKDLKSTAPVVEWRLRALDGAALTEWAVAQQQATGPLAVVLGSEGEGILAQTRLGFSSGTGEGVSVAIEDLSAVAPIFAAARPLAAHDSKSLSVALTAHGVEIAPAADDVMLYEFLVAADPGAASLEVMALRYLDRKLSGSIEERAAAVWMVAEKLRSEIARRPNLARVCREIDLPLAPVLARMERVGVRLAPEALKTMSAEMEKEIDRLSAEIFREAGQPFNINSPQQLGKILFEDLKIPSPVQRAKSAKSWSTAADILETLAEEHAIARLVLEYRQVAKLKSTYVDTLPLLVRTATGRVHTTFNPAGAATGRLSSHNPNLQNIPIRTELGRAIRAAFVPREGWELVVADYSQIELRLLAYFSGDPVLTSAFRNGEDIHARTAAEVMGVPRDAITADMRRAAKAVNFGIVYGLSAFGLAQQLGIPRGEAEKYIRGYFERYAGVKSFIEKTIAEVRATGVTRTLHGRERPIPDINTRNPNARGFAERTAVNTPLQGTAADLIKIAMIRIDRRLRQESWQSAMLLQVHDELVFEAPPAETQRLREMVKHEMESVEPLSVPLLVDTGAGANWRDAK
ncbi:MAG: DNA polymerase I [Acidobacteria bacterium]|nr:DNA polymerase I [Acidobacteriota bacterium]